MAYNTLKYYRIDPALRDQKRNEWNKPVLWPIGAGTALLVIILLPAWVAYRRKQQQQSITEQAT